MKVLQRLFKLVQEKQAANSNIANKKEEITHHNEEGKKEIITSKNQKANKRSRKHERINLDCNDLNKNLAALIRSENMRACFSKTLYIYSVKIKKEDIIRGHSKQVSASSSLATAHNAGNKVLPINDTSKTSSTKRSKQIGNGEKSNKPKTMSKMKELMRWSAAAKSHKGGKPTGIKVLHFKNREGVKGLPSGEAELISESPKISFSFINPERCSTVGSDQCDCGPGKGNWITTDDEFVVLEL